MVKNIILWQLPFFCARPSERVAGAGTNLWSVKVLSCRTLRFFRECFPVFHPSVLMSLVFQRIFCTFFAEPLWIWKRIGFAGNRGEVGSFLFRKWWLWWKCDFFIPFSQSHTFAAFQISIFGNFSLYVFHPRACFTVANLEVCQATCSEPDTQMEFILQVFVPVIRHCVEFFMHERHCRSLSGQKGSLRCHHCGVSFIHYIGHRHIWSCLLQITSKHCGSLRKTSISCAITLYQNKRG